MAGVDQNISSAQNEATAPAPNEANSSAQNEATAPVPTDNPIPGRRLRVLACTFALSPVRGSEAAIGWQLVARLAKYHDVTALCTPGVTGRDRDEIEGYTRTHGPVSGLTVHYVEPTPVARFFESNSSSLLRSMFVLGNRSWHKAAYREALRLHAEKPFDVAHMITITGYREPGFFWKLPIPFFWGPVAGASDVPWRYLSMMGWRDRLAYGARNVANWLQMRFSLRPLRAAKKASAIWAVAPDNTGMITDIWGYPSEHIYECAAVPRPGQPSKHFTPGETLRLVASSYCVGRKALPIALRALAKVKGQFPVELTIMGDGPEKSRWMELSDQLGLGTSVRWMGNLPHKDAMAEMERGHVFVFPSLKEGTSSVVPESLSLGLPVITHDMCGMSLMINDACGIKVAPLGPEQSAEGFAAAIRRMATEPGLIDRLSIGALRRAEECTWEHNARMFAAAYERAVTVGARR